MIYNLFGDVTPKLYDDIKQLIEDNPNDRELLINIDTYGGNLATAFSLADYLRSMPDLNVKTHVQGNCMSAGTIISLIAPKENRSATMHSVFMCHSPLTQTSGLQDTETISCLADTMKGALNELVNIYCDRTGMELKDVQDLVNSKREFYASEALKMGFISSIDTLYNYNKKNNSLKMKKSILKAICNRLVNALVNEVYRTSDGKEIEIGDLAIGGSCSAEDGVYELSDGTVITVESSTIVDIIPAEQPEPETIENEGETEEPTVEPEQIAEEVAETVEEVVADEEVTDATEIAEIVKEVVEEQMTELAELKELVEKCGGKKKLQNLAKVKHQAKVFNTTPTTKIENKQRSIKELMGLKRK